ncbi:MAG TPA: hypothetical protein VF522_14230 [Ramlibacter sp.]|uniref:hypothetical protein n=1 Tax=Ramlibacter sp. TaxID=1917967 RepID=UPI002ED5EAB8
MGEDKNIASLRSRVTALVQEEGVLLSQAFDVSREGGDRRGVDALFARVQALQVERNKVQKEIGHLLGGQRMHVAAEVWKPGVYDYRQEVGGGTVRVRIAKGPLGLQALFPGRSKPVSIETLGGAFEGPLAVDEPLP